jgi:hypothetical protein
VTRRLSCACGAVHIEVEKAPIVSSECYCPSCREAGGRMQALPGAPTLVDEKGGTRFVLYRKDRVRFVKGVQHFREFRLNPDAPTRRVVATCCNTPVFLEFQGGHWLSLYAGLWPAGALPPLGLRTRTQDPPDPSVLGRAVPAGAWPTASFFAKLLGAWIAMGFRSPKIAVNGAIDA